MSYEVKLKTGFFETTLYQLSLFHRQVHFVPIADAAKDIIEITEDDLVMITLTKRKHPKIEVQTRNQNFIGIFTQKLDLREVQHNFKKYIRKKVIYEEE